ncbi:MAG: chorismate synthase [Oscillospiraceae bacterium]|nr:chorismate synthase [Oscillospiraceae bacterium]
MSSIWRGRLGISVFGEASGPAIGVTVDNLPPGEYIDTDMLRFQMGRRLTDRTGLVTGEAQMPSIMSGIQGCRTTGSPVMALITNNEFHPDESGNAPLIARPGNADYTGAVRYKGFNDLRNDGHLSKKLIAPLIFAGAICAQILERRSIYVGAHIAQIHNIKDTPFDPVNIDRDGIVQVRRKAFPVISDRQGVKMRSDIARAGSCGDSLGGVIECAVTNLPVGIGSPMFDGLENTVSQLIFGIPLVTGVEFGAGFKAAQMIGSQYNDEFYADDHGYVKTRTNNHGGILGGITSGMPLIFRASFKPNPTLGMAVNAIDCTTLENTVTGENSAELPCLIPSYVPAVEAAAAIAVLSHIADYPNF